MYIEGGISKERISHFMTEELTIAESEKTVALSLLIACVSMLWLSVICLLLAYCRSSSVLEERIFHTTSVISHFTVCLYSSLCKMS